MDLQRSVENGEIDLESLGVMAVTVPQEQLQRMPKYLFTCERQTGSPRENHEENHEETVGHMFQSMQTSCAICLDQFVNS